MVFSSLIFIFYFLTFFFLIYFLTPVRYRNFPLLIFSILFYAWGAPKFTLVILSSLLVNYYIVYKLNQSKDTKRKIYLLLSIAINLTLLGYFKYFNFFIENINNILGLIELDSIEVLKITLPIGISFFTFQSITYSLDVYRRVKKPLNSPVKYFTYILMFPQLIAGPIVRYKEIADQIEDKHRISKTDDILYGIFRFTIGLSKKVIIANTLGAYADKIYSMPIESIDTPLAWIAAISYTFQIYFDFSGYSDMAIGLGRIIGFHFPENFNTPYISASITEFWKRWHVTLGNFMREYLYIPLGGNRKGNNRTYFNLWIVFLLSGLWHGASWNFVIWGCYHGVFLVLERKFLSKSYKKMPSAIPITITFLLTVVSWVFFRVDTFTDASIIINKLFNFTSFSYESFTIKPNYWFILGFAIFFSFAGVLPIFKRIENIVFYKEKLSLSYVLIMFVILIPLFALSIGTLTASSFNPFIYFRF